MDGFYCTEDTAKGNPWYASRPAAQQPKALFPADVPLFAETYHNKYGPSGSLIGKTERRMIISGGFV